MSRPTYVMGLDLGPPGEPTGFAVLERPTESLAEPVYHLRHLERFPVGESYPTIIEAVAKKAGTPPLCGAPLVVDRTAVGKAIIDHLRRARLCVIQVVISAGQAVQPLEGGGDLVPKKELVTGLQLLLQARRLKVAPGLASAEVLVAELAGFRLRQVPVGTLDSAEWRVGRHDDLVFAVALACWYADRHPARFRIGLGPSILATFPGGSFRGW
jgi:hypothetical protein